MSLAFESVVFDLDGTLIDSASGILQAFTAAFAHCGVTPRQAWNASLIGPPLLQTIAQQCGSQDPALLESLRAAFIASYDSEGFRLSTPYDGVHEMLENLRSQGVRLFIATNKRILPTGRVLQYLEWDALFEGIFGADSLAPTYTPKAEVIQHIIQHFGLIPGNSLYVGDRLEDYQAATAAGLPFALATWGFGDADALVPKTCARVHTADNLRRLVLSAKTATRAVI